VTHAPKEIAVGLSRHQPQPALALLELVDQVQLVVALDRLGIRLRRRIANRAQNQHQGRQPLLPVDDQIGGDPARGRRHR
jgi:hypothetical protein